MRKIGLTFLFLCFFANAFAQNLSNAKKLYDKKDYTTATTLFLKIEPKTQEVLEKLGDCYFFTSNMEDASRWYKELMDAHKETTNAIYYYRYSQALYGIENYKEANYWLQKYQGKKIINPDYISNISSEYNYLTNKKSPYKIRKLATNTPVAEFGGAFLNNKLVFASSDNEGSKYNWNNEPYLNLVVADINNAGELENIAPFSKEINSEKHESNAIFTKDGKTMYFTASNREKRSKRKVNHLKIYKAELIEETWQNITDLSINDIEFSTEHPALNEDETKLYFSSDREGTVGSFDLYVVDILENGNLGEPKNLGNKINTELREQFPYVRKDTLFFASTGHFGLGGLDIFKSAINKDGTFSTPENLGPGINSNLDDFGFVINEEETFGYLSSNRIGGAGGDDIYLFKKEIPYTTFNGIIKDKNTLEPIANTTIDFLKNNENFKNVTSNNDGTFSFDINKKPNEVYSLKANNPLYKPTTRTLDLDNANANSPYILFLEKKESPYVTFNGIVKDAKTLEPIPNATIEFLKDNTNFKDLISNSDGTFSFNVDNKPENTYGLKASKSLYKPVNRDFNYKDINPDTPYVIYLEKYVDDKAGDIIYKNNKTQIFHEPILFDLNSSYLTAKAKIILDNIVSVLNKYPEINIRCESHTDSRATDKYNMWLSKRRAKRTAEYIISKGISSSRITQDGYGETNLLNNCSNGVSCSEEEHHLNRRTEFVLLQ